MKYFALIVIFCLCAFMPVQAQTPEEPTATVLADSAYVRALPTTDSEAVSSVFEDEQLIVVGRNLDGTWFQVRRPGRLNNLGWVYSSLLNWEFRSESLPLTDTTTGLLGETLLVEYSGFSVYVIDNVNMRIQPQLDAEKITVVPWGTTVPVLARDRDGSWLKVNYLGIVGWITTFNVRRLPNLLEVPVAADLPPEPEVNTSVLIIPPEVQLAGTQRLRDFIAPHLAFTFELETFWNEVMRGEVMPCEPPPFAQEYLYTQDDERAFPELHYLVPRMGDGLVFINASIGAMYTCGVLDPDVVRKARNDAVNARIVFEATLDAISNIEFIIRNR